MKDTTLHPVDMRALVASQNSEALMTLLRTTGIVLGPNAAQWRPTLRTTGHITGLFGQLTILMTDGIVAWFRDATGALVFGHIQCFDGKVAPLHSVPKPSKTDSPVGAKRIRQSATKKPSQPAASLALELLAQMLTKTPQKP